MFRKLSQTINYEKVEKINKLLNNCLFSSIKTQINNKISLNINENQVNNGLNSFVTRTHTCGQLSELNVGQRVRLCGWIQFQRLGKFVTLRDSYGITQLMVNNNNKHLQKTISKLMPESVIEVCGQVCRRPHKDINNNLKTGSIEVIVEEMIVWNNCRNDIPFIIRDYSKVSEKVRLQFRYIDLRHERMQYNLRIRSQVINKMRNFLIDNYGFVEVETPTLFKKTPGVGIDFFALKLFTNFKY
jgi:aspartyl-tRNA synthetase